MISSTQESLSDTVRQMATGFARTQELYTMVKLDIADHLSDGPKQSHELAHIVDAHPQALHRFLRKLVVLNLLAQDDDGAFRISPMGELLCSNHPESLRTLILYIGEMSYHAQRELLYSVKTGRPAFDYVFGMSFFDFFAEHPEIGAWFNDLMSEGINDRAAGIVAAYDFSQADTIVDVGGGNGTLISAILNANARPRGIVFDRPNVVTEAQLFLDDEGLSDRCQTIAGDVFHDPIPPNGDIYLLSQIVHDWDDDHAKWILRNCRAVLRDSSRLLLIEGIMPEQATEAPATIGSDLSMLMLTGGRERTEAEYRQLLSAAGFQIVSVIPVESSRVYMGRKPSWAIIDSRPS
jgi:hypothetical protein